MKYGKFLMILCFAVFLISCIDMNEEIKIRQIPEMVWFKTCGGEFRAAALSTIETKNQEFITVGFGMFNKQYKNDLYVIKTSSSGDTIWTKTFPADGNNGGKSIVPYNENYVISGETSREDGQGWDINIVCIDDNGNELWRKKHENQRSEIGRKIISADENSFIVLASSSNAQDADDESLRLMKIDENGNAMWSKTFKGNNYTSGFDIIKTADQNYMIAGTTMSSGDTSKDIYLLKIDSEGNELWSHTYGGALNDIASSIVEVSDGSYIVCSGSTAEGELYGEVKVMKIDGIGEMTWSNTFEEQGYVSSAVVTVDGSIYIAGTTNSVERNMQDVMVVKINSSGEKEWMRTFGGTAYDNGFSIIQATNGNLIVSGTVDVTLMKTDAFVTEMRP